VACSEATVLSPELSASFQGLAEGDGESKLQVSVLVVDTQTLFRSGLARLLSEDDRISVAGVSDGGPGLPDLCAALSIDVVVTDIQVRDWDAVALTRIIAKVSPATRVLILASTADWRVVPAMAAGVAGFLLKDAEPEAVRSAVLSVYLGGQVLCPDASRRLLQGEPDYRLTRRESDVLRLIAEGAGNREIAEQLQLGDKTVRNYVSRLYRKLAMHNRGEITSVAMHAADGNGQVTNLSATPDNFTEYF
jgi:DNA-binding NarL/FixJ family response regulator